MRITGIRRFRWWAAIIAVLLFAVASPGANVTPTHAQSGMSASFTTPTIDGDPSDWAEVPGRNLTLSQFDNAGTEWDFNGDVAPVNALLKVANDNENIYILVIVTDTFDYVADDHKLSAALGVMFNIDPLAGPHMGSEDDHFEAGLRMVDIWHWELDCAAGALSGGGPAGSGNDPDCNLDDEYATDPETREDDDGAGAENSLGGSWNHDGTNWIFEMSRPLNTGDATDAQFTAGGTAKIALAYWDPKESAIGWSDAGHLTSSDVGWIQVNLATQDAPSGDTPTTGGTPGVPPVGNAGLAIDAAGGGFPVRGALIAGLLGFAIVATAVAFSMKKRQT